MVAILLGITNYTIDAYTASVEGTIMFTVDDRSGLNESLYYKGTATNWETVPMYDDGTNGDEEAGDHVWTVIIENISVGDHQWGALNTDNGDGTSCIACDGSDGWGTWLIQGPNIEYNLESDLLTYHGQTNYIIVPLNFNVNITFQADMTSLLEWGWDDVNDVMRVNHGFWYWKK